MSHNFKPGQRWDSVKFKIWYFLYLYEEHGFTKPLSVAQLAFWTGTNLRSVQVLVIRWRSRRWRRVLLRRLPDGQYGYILGSRGRQWLADARLFIPEQIRETWVSEIIDHQQEIKKKRN
jgi:hypothetical protein